MYWCFLVGEAGDVDAFEEVGDKTDGVGEKTLIDFARLGFVGRLEAVGESCLAVLWEMDLRSPFFFATAAALAFRALCICGMDVCILQSSMQQIHTHHENQNMDVTFNQQTHYSGNT